MKIVNLKNNDMISLITQSVLLKYAFGYSFSLAILSFFEQNLGGGDFFTKILNAIPSRIVAVLGIIYGISLVAKQISDTWKNHQLNKLTVKKEIEHLEQEEITTEKQRQEL